ncbi:peptidylprolyl isomerase [Janthinobacterium sp. 17J80-10]|uniref:peptidylprolyl isomerase n=1 Tax=Janthinobacterium sp. 17J80-10 TaxID=2497863 RepID=UPI001005450F|nr:peptidylprolyl isomerase [Janthinobacterium sp. 17J80-10]QAU35643.1 molecular chaperone SurA [Janthinobacterium sp. 17J80-10]
MRNTRLPFSRSALACILSCMAIAATPNAWSQFKPGAGPVAPVAAGTAGVRTIDAIVAVVNNEVITQKELDDRTESIARRIAAQGQGQGGMPPRAELQRQVLERMIVEVAQLQLAKEMNIQVDDTMLDRAVARIAEQNRMNLQEFRNQLEREGITFAKFREEIRREIIMQRLREREVDNRLQISESEIENYLAAGAGTGQQQEWNLAQILVRIPENASPEQIEQRRQRAEQLVQQLKSGADFAKVAAASSDADDALKGGEIGWRNQDRLPQLFVDAVANLQSGEVGPLVKSANGFHILKLIGKRTPSVMRASTGTAAAPASITQTRVRHILIKVNQIVSSLDAQRKLQDLKQRLDNKAATFEELARSHSNDLTASKGGDLGWIYPGDTVPEFERAMDALQPGQISEPIESPFGFHLIQVLERKTEDVSQERKRLVARQALRERKLEEATQEWLRQVRDRAYVEYRNEEK